MSGNPVDTTLKMFSSSLPASSSKFKKHRKAKMSNPNLAKFTKANIYPGKFVLLDKESELFSLFSHAKWDHLLFHPTRRVLTELVTEFYSNLRVGYRLDQVAYLNSMLIGEANSHQP